MSTSKLIQALSNQTFTENAMPTNKSSGNANLDMFYKIGGMRGKDPIAVFSAAFNEDPLMAMKNLFCTRDIRGGKGERQLFRTIVAWLTKNHPTWIRANMHLIPKWGRWDDVFSIMEDKNSDIAQEAAGFFMTAILNGDKLAAKWAPRHGKKGWQYGQLMIHVMSAGEYNPAGDKDTKHRYEAKYRNALKISRTVEQQMSAKQWDLIEFDHVPSQASLKYRKTFFKHCEERYKAYLGAVTRGEKKIHAGTLQPHQVIEQIAGGDSSETLDALWANRPNFLGEGRQPICMVDVSGSMFDSENSVWKAISIGLDLSERMNGPFKDSFIAFSAVPMVYTFKPNQGIRSRVNDLKQHQSDWGYNTDFVLASKNLLATAIKINLDPKDFPTHIVVLSDMQWDVSQLNPTSKGSEILDDMYSKSPYKRPTFIFWNLRTSKGVPVEKQEKGYVLVSGFSSSAIKVVLGGEEPEAPPTPMEIFLKTMEEYSEVSSPL